MNYCAIILSKLLGILLNEVHLYKLQVLEGKKSLEFALHSYLYPERPSPLHFAPLGGSSLNYRHRAQKN